MRAENLQSWGETGKTGEAMSSVLEEFGAVCGTLYLITPTGLSSQRLRRYWMVWHRRNRIKGEGSLDGIQGTVHYPPVFNNV